MSKGIVYTIAFLIAIVSVSASYMPVSDIMFEFKGATCDDNGTITINITHEGRSIKYSDIGLTIHSDNLQPMKMQGKWYIGDYPSSNYEAPQDNYTDSSFDYKQKFTFKTTNNVYTKEKYTVTLSWPSISEYQNNIKFAITCPGLKCSSDNQCVSEQSCVNNVCTWLSCGEESKASGHSCIPLCDDKNICTRDNYIDGQCIFTEIEKCCATGDDCKKEEICKDNECVEKSSVSTNPFIKFWNWLKGLYK